jgi:hypothetical protein
MSGAPIVGYRAWSVVDSELRSLFVEQSVWPAGERMVAECLPHRLHGQPMPHDAPCQQCECGIYARTTLPGIFDEIWMRGMVKSPDTVVGAVLLFGVTYHGKSGPHVIRAQYAQPICLMASDAWYPMQLPDDPEQNLAAWRGMLGRVSQRYGLPVVPRTSIEQYAAEFGEPLCTTEDERVTRTHEEPRWRAWWQGLGLA